FFFQAEDGIRDRNVTGVQTCALPIYIKLLQKQGVKPVIVHGGGPAIKEGLDKLNLNYEFVDGLRKTSDEMIDVVEKVLSGSVNSALTRQFNKHQLKAIGLSG